MTKPLMYMFSSNIAIKRNMRTKFREIMEIRRFSIYFCETYKSFEKKINTHDKRQNFHDFTKFCSTSEM